LTKRKSNSHAWRDGAVILAGLTNAKDAEAKGAHDEIAWQYNVRKIKIGEFSVGLQKLPWSSSNCVDTCIPSTDSTLVHRLAIAHVQKGFV
jgi:hypothetical protein